MSVLISGAGLAGLTTAYWLQRYGFTPTIVERAPSLLVGGYKIDVRGTALQVLKRMGIHDVVVAASTDMQGAVLVDKNGNVINEMTADAFGHRVGEDLEIVRGTLCRIVKLNQALGIKSANLMKYKEKSDPLSWLTERIMQIAPGRLLEFFINRSTQRIHQAANAIALKDYSA
jgi:FAD binding domain